MTERTIPAGEIARGDLVRFTPRDGKQTVTVAVTGFLGADPIGYRPALRRRRGATAGHARPYLVPAEVTLVDRPADTHPADAGAAELRAQREAPYVHGEEAAALDIAQGYATTEDVARDRYRAAWTKSVARDRDPEAMDEALFWLGYADQLAHQQAPAASTDGDR